MTILVFAASLALTASTVFAADDATAQEEQRYQQSIAEFTQKMKNANYPALFDKAAQEFNVPADILKGVAFAETRWTQLQWPPGETASPATGMPRPYGIMSLWDNDYFGHSLLEAAKLIGQDPEVLKTDAYQNMRGAAALLRQLYDSTPKPADAPDEKQIESWRKAIVKYSGIPLPELSEQHALKVYEFMNQGYHHYGLEWDAHPVNLGPMREDVARIQAAAHNRLQIAPKPEKLAASTPPAPASLETIATNSPTGTNSSAADPLSPPHPTSAQQLRQRWYLAGLMALLLIIAFAYRRRGAPKSTEVGN
jgi:hypothetical protein